MQLCIVNVGLMVIVVWILCKLCYRKISQILESMTSMICQQIGLEIARRLGSTVTEPPVTFLRDMSILTHNIAG